MFRSLTVIATIIAVFSVNLISYNLSARLDFTEGGIYTLSDSTKNILSKLEKEIEIKVFMSEKLPPQAIMIKQSIRDYLDEYEAISNGNLNISYIDPVKDSDSVMLAQYLGIPELQLQVIEKDQRQIVKAYMGLAVLREKENFEKSEDNQNPLAKYEKYDSIPVLQDLGSFEYDLTSTILKISSDNEKVVGFLTGHGEHELTSEQMANGQSDYPLKDILSKNYKVKTISINEENPKIEGVDTIVIGGPKEAFKEFEIKTIKEFIASGKNALFLIDRIEIGEGLIPSKMEEDFSSLLEDWGVSVNSNLVKDRASTNASFTQGFITYSLPYPFWVKTSNLNKENSITTQLDSFILPWTSSLEIKGKEGINVDILAKTSNYYSLAETEVKKMVPVDKEADKKEESKEPEMKEVIETQNIDLNPQQDFGITREEKNPLPLAVIAQKEGEGKVLVVGDSDFASASFIGQFRANLVFFMNAIDAFTLGDELISIRSKIIEDRPIIELSEFQKNLIKWGNIFLMPIVFVAYGLARRSFRNAKKRLI